jgi:hypothetical protein
MAVIKFPRPYQEPLPEPEQLSLWPELLPTLPEPLSKRELLRLRIAQITDEIAGAVAHLRARDIAGVFGHLHAARKYLEWLDDDVCEVEP